MAPQEEHWAGRVALVTGGCGFIGSHLVEALLAAGADVRVLDAYNSFSHHGHLEGLAHERLDVTLGDVADPFLVRQLCEGVDTVFHLAALIGIPYSYTAPAHYVQTNVNGTLAVLEAVRDLPFPLGKTGLTNRSFGITACGTKKRASPAKEASTMKRSVALSPSTC